MIDVKNSELLDKIIEYAKAYGNMGEAPLTAERYLISIIDVVSGDAAIDINDEEKNRLRKVLSETLSEEWALKNVKASLNEHIKEKKEGSYIDGLYIQRLILKARNEAKKKGLDILSPELLLSCIFEEPNAYIKSCLDNSKKNGRKDTAGAADEDGLLWELDQTLDHLFGPESKATDKDNNAGEQVLREASKTTVAKITEKARMIQDELLKSVFGQNYAVSVFASGYFQSEILSVTDKDRSRPRATFLFAGPPGVGKTFLAEKAAKALDLPYMRFDMSEYSDKEATCAFCGSDKVYKNAQEGNVTSFVAKNPKCVILFDEIEKAHINVIHLFLQILDAGHIHDIFTDQEVSFADAILIFTTNAGKQLYENSQATDFSNLTRKVILKALQKDTNPETGATYFPAAICSRFASGNVVMFNHMSAHNLRDIAKREVLKRSTSFENEVGIKIDIDESVYTALLFAEGSNADARTIKSRAETFFDDELFELFRLLASKSVDTEIEGLESIHIGVDLPSDDKELCELFERSDSYDVLVFSSKKNCDLCSALSPGTKFTGAQNLDEAKAALNDHDISFVLIDINFEQYRNKKYLNIEDVASEARDFLWFVKETYPSMPIYLLQTDERVFNEEEILSFMRQGIRGIITIAENKDGFEAEIKAINDQLHQQKSMEILAKENKLVSYETAQSVENEGKNAEIILFDFEMSTAVEAEDTQNVMSNVSKPNVTFDRIVGAENAKDELKFFIEYLKNPKKFMGTGLRAPRGVLLYGPPGTGKTMLAKAVASEAGVTFISAEGNQFINKYIGQGKDDLHKLFSVARKYAPAILFIDEFEAIAKERVGGDHSSANGEDVLTALLTEMDGFNTDITRPVFVLAATNFDITPGTGKSLDRALLRRFDSKIYVDLPNRDERIRFINIKCSGNKAFNISKEEIENIAVRSTGMSLADLDSIMELSLRTAIKNKDKKVTDPVLDEAFETFIGGEKKDWDLSQLERTARHEAGHTFLCWHSGEVPSYVTIVARGDHGGYMRHDDNEGKFIYTKEDLLARIRTSLGGRAAELVYYGEKDGVSTGASGDLASATNLARQIICTYGMNEQFGLAVIGAEEAKKGEISVKVREEINAILNEEMKKAKKIIEENRASIDALVDRLLSDNHLTGEEIVAIFKSNNGQ